MHHAHLWVDARWALQAQLCNVLRIEALRAAGSGVGLRGAQQRHEPLLLGGSVGAEYKKKGLAMQQHTLVGATHLKRPLCTSIVVGVSSVQAPRHNWHNALQEPGFTRRATQPPTLPHSITSTLRIHTVRPLSPSVTTRTRHPLRSTVTLRGGAPLGMCAGGSASCNSNRPLPMVAYQRLAMGRAPRVAGGQWRRMSLGS